MAQSVTVQRSLLKCSGKIVEMSLDQIPVSDPEDGPMTPCHQLQGSPPQPFAFGDEPETK